MGNSPRPGAWVLEKSDDYGLSYQAWQYFANSTQDCYALFKLQADKKVIDRDDEVICTTKYSKIHPISGGEVI